MTADADSVVLRARERAVERRDADEGDVARDGQQVRRRSLRAASANEPEPEVDGRASTRGGRARAGTPGAAAARSSARGRAASSWGCRRPWWSRWAAPATPRATPMANGSKRRRPAVRRCRARGRPARRASGCRARRSASSRSRAVRSRRASCAVDGIGQARTPSIGVARRAEHVRRLPLARGRRRARCSTAPRSNSMPARPHELALDRPP